MTTEKDKIPTATPDNKAGKTNPKLKVKLTPSKFKLAEYLRTVHAASPEPGTTVEQMLDPGFWSHVAAKMKKGDRIEAVTEDGILFAEFYVRHANHLEAHVTLMRQVQLGKAKKNDVMDVAKMFPDHEIRYAANKWRIVRKEDKAILKDDFKSKPEAIQWLSNYLEEIAA